jgi:hypothetical protein
MRLGPYYYSLLEFVHHGDWVRVVFVPYPHAKERKEVLRFSISALCVQHPETRSRAEPGSAENGSQPIRSETNSTSGAAGPRR